MIYAIIGTLIVAWLTYCGFVLFFWVRNGVWRQMSQTANRNFMMWAVVVVVLILQPVAGVIACGDRFDPLFQGFDKRESPEDGRSKTDGE